MPASSTAASAAPAVGLLLLLASLSSPAAGASPARGRRGTLSNGKVPAPCDPARCVTARFDFVLTWPAGSNNKYTCPAAGANSYEQSVAATFAGGFGAWSAGQCVHKSYTPGILAFAGPGAYSGDYVPACPSAVYCACDGARDKLVAIMNNPASDYSAPASNPIYWASLAPRFALAQGFGNGGGGSGLDLIYQHPDGRRQFCGAVNSMTYSEQNGRAFPESAPASPSTLDHKPSGYTTSCSWFPASCHQPTYTETRADGCGWWRKTRTCKPAGNGNAPLAESTLTAAPITAVASTPPAWSSWPATWGACSKQCGGGQQSKTRVCNQRTGQHASQACTGDATQSQACNEVACGEWASSSFSYTPSCPAGYAHHSTEWVWWGGRKWTCRQSP